MRRPAEGRAGRDGDPAARSALLAPSWAPIATLVAVIVTALIGALVWHSTRLGWLDAWALRALGAETYFGFQLASAISSSLRVLALVAAPAIAAFAWSALGRMDAVVLALGAPAVTLGVEKLLKQLVARRSPGSGVFLYPSGHLAVATALALTLVLVLRLARVRSGVMAVAVASVSLALLVVARARLAETAHSLSDVIGGIATGVAVTLAAALLLDARLLNFVKDRRTR
jgi:membrane-associated phospholipid phosphatase